MSTSIPTTMMDFFRKSEGMWMTQRSVHHFDITQDESGESNLTVQVIEPDDEKIASVLALRDLEAAQVAGGARFMWQPNLDLTEPNPDYAAVLIDLPDEGGRSGRLLRDRGYVEKIPVISHYWFANDGVLTINTDYDNNQGQERCWFITDDFRVRVSTVRMMNGVNLMTYCSERRCLSHARLERMAAAHASRTEDGLLAAGA
ncbi:MAG: phycobiliprotein lyase [Cyanobacteria bacterium P01_D01_bin.123]